MSQIGDLPVKMDTDGRNYVVQANTLIEGKQALSLNACKLLRLAIMQIKKTDTKLQAYFISVKDLATLLSVDSSNLYRNADALAEEIMTSKFSIHDDEKQNFFTINLVSYCKYDRKSGFTIKLNDDLKAYTLELTGMFTRYHIEEILDFKSTYSIRFYELICESIGKNGYYVVPKEGITVNLPLKELRTACNIEDKFDNYSQLKEKVIDKAIKEVNEKTGYLLTYTPKKTGKKITHLEINIARNFFPPKKYG